MRLDESVFTFTKEAPYMRACTSFSSGVLFGANILHRSPAIAA
jgi:hypothetical protein